MTESKHTQLLTVILGVCIALPRIVMPTYFPISKGLVWVEMLAEMIGIISFYNMEQENCKLNKVKI